MVKGMKQSKRAVLALLLASVLFAAGKMPALAADQEAIDAQAAAEAQAAAQAALVQAAAEARAAADAQAAAAAQAEAYLQTVIGSPYEQGARAAAEAEAAKAAQLEQQAQALEIQAGTRSQPPARSAPAADNDGPKADGETKVRISEQLKKDIEDSLEKNAQDAIIDGYLSLLNKDYVLRDELDMELSSIGNGHELEARAAREITRMVNDARTQGLRISITSSYRTYAKQVSLFKNKISRLERQGYSHAKAVEEAAKIVAVPGTSEHHLGLTVDFVTGSYRELDEGIKSTKEYVWVEEHAWEYGYVIRYPSGKSDITGIISEPWHLRYVGIPAAKLMTEQELCLEEFLGVAYDGQKNGISHGAGWANTGR